MRKEGSQNPLKGRSHCALTKRTTLVSRTWLIILAVPISTQHLVNYTTGANFHPKFFHFIPPRRTDTHTRVHMRQSQELVLTPAAILCHWNAVAEPVPAPPPSTILFIPAQTADCSQFKTFYGTYFFFSYLIKVHFASF